MISPIDIISYDTRPQEFQAPTLPLQGPSFADYLVRVEDERSPAVQRPGTAAADSDDAAPLKEDDSVSSGDESRSARGAAVDEREAPERTEATEQKDPAGPSSKDESNSDAKSAGTEGDKGGGSSAEKGEASEAAERVARASGRKERGNAKAADAGGTLLQRKEASGGAEKAGAEAADSAAAQVTKAANPEAQLLPAGEAVEDEKVSGKEASLQAQALPAEANPLQHPPVKDSAQATEVSVAGEKGADRRAGRTGTASAGRAEESRPALELVDLRRAGKGEAEARQSGSGGENGETRSFSTGNQLSAENGQNLRQEVMVLESTGGRSEAAGLKGDALPSRAAEELSRALKEGGNNEILKRARITLKDSNQGEIRLILKPERLGEVQIRLNLSDRHIAGRIIVENSSVREVFQENMEALNRAFRESGYQTAGLEVSVGGREGSFGRQKERTGAARSTAHGAAMLDEQVPRVHSDQYAMSRINVYV